MSADVSSGDDDSSTALFSVEQRRRADARRWRYSDLLVPFLLAVLLFTVVVVPLTLHRQELDSRTVSPEPGETSGQHGAINDAVSGTSDESSETGLAKIKLELLRTKLDMELAQASQAIRHSESARSAWANLLAATLSDTVGKRIAGSEKLLLRFDALRKMLLPEQCARNLASDLRTHRNEADRAADAAALKHLTDGTVTTRQNADVAFAFHQARVNELQAIRQVTALLSPGNLDIAEALNRRGEALAAVRDSAAEQAAGELAESLDSEFNQLEKQRTDGADLVSQLQSELALVAKGESVNATSDIQNSQTQGSREDYQRELDRIRTDLVAFTTPGYVQPESANKLVYHKVKRPFSYSALQRIGALQDSEEGRETLLRVGGSKTATQQNDRPLGNFPKMNSNSELAGPEIIVCLKEAQRLLRQYGHLMIEDGLLSP